MRFPSHESASSISRVSGGLAGGMHFRAWRRGLGGAALVLAGLAMALHGAEKKREERPLPAEFLLLPRHLTHVVTSCYHEK